MEQRHRPVGRTMAVGALLGATAIIIPQPASAAIITVDALGDAIDGTDGVTTLPEAIIEANTTLGADEIVFDATVFDPAAGPYTITTALTFDVTDDLTITGPGIDVLDVSSSNPDGTPHHHHRQHGDGNCRDGRRRRRRPHARPHRRVRQHR